MGWENSQERRLWGLEGNQQLPVTGISQQRWGFTWGTAAATPPSAAAVGQGANAGHPHGLFRCHLWVIWSICFSIICSTAPELGGIETLNSVSPVVSTTKLCWQCFQLSSCCFLPDLLEPPTHLQFWGLKELNIHRFGDPPFSFLLSKIFLPMRSHSSTPGLHYLIHSVALCCSDWGVPSLEELCKNRWDPVWFPSFEIPSSFCLLFLIR